MVNLLIVEDDENILLLTYLNLKNEYHIFTAKNGKEALNIIYNKKIALMITDIMMPQMNGYELVETIRQEGFNFPVIFLTAKNSFDDKQKGFSLEIDDYLTKPFHFEELRWHIRSLLRRCQINTSKQIVIGDIIIDEKTYTIQKEGNIISLSKKEFQLLYKLLSYPNMIFTKNQLLDEIWGYDSESSEDTIKTHINKLRQKCASFTQFKISTVRGLGYKGEVIDEG